MTKHRISRPRAAPLSIRLSDDQRRDLNRRAGGRNLSTYIKHALFTGEQGTSSENRLHADVPDRKLLGEILARLGASSAFPNLKAIARLAEAGALLIDEGTLAQLNAACADVREIRGQLMIALGKDPDARSIEILRAGLKAFQAAARGSEDQS